VFATALAPARFAFDQPACCDGSTTTPTPIPTTTINHSTSRIVKWNMVLRLLTCERFYESLKIDAGDSSRHAAGAWFRPVRKVARIG
jgi:hypothetical protein